jgi:hypothetical protein
MRNIALVPTGYETGPGHLNVHRLFIAIRTIDFVMTAPSCGENVLKMLSV